MPTNLDLVRSIYADWERGDFSRSDWATPQIEYGSVGGPDPGMWTGVAAMAERWGEWLHAWRDFRAVPEEYLVVDGEQVLVLVQNTGQGKTSGLGVVQQSVANLFQLRDGKVTRLVIYFDRDRALADLGLMREGQEPGEPSAAPLSGREGGSTIRPMARFRVGAAVVHQDRPNQRGRITEIRADDPVEYQVRWSDTRVLGLVAESALLPADEDDLDEQQLEDDAGSLD